VCSSDLIDANGLLARAIVEELMKQNVPKKAELGERPPDVAVYFRLVFCDLW
jgi:hypothetical protein